MSTSTPDAGGLSDIGSSLSSGSGGVGSNSFGFTMPSGTDTSGGDSFAGLSGLQSGMSLPSIGGGANSFGFSMPGGGMPDLSSLSNGLGAASKTLSTPTSTNRAGGAGRGGMMLRPQTFTSPIDNELSNGGSAGGNSLIALLQKYRPGVTA